MRTKRHVILAEMIKNAGQLNIVPPLGQLLDRVLNKANKLWIDVARLGNTSLGRPINHLSATVCELGDSDILFEAGFERLRKTELRTESVIIARRPQRLPSIRRLVSTTQTVLKRDPGIVRWCRKRRLLPQ